MVTFKGASRLMQLSWDLSYVLERCRSVAEIAPMQSVQVKGENLILEVLKREYKLIENISETFDRINSVRDSMREWIAYLDKRYNEKWTFLGPPIILEANDADRLAKDCQMWLSSIMESFSKEGTILLKEDTPTDFLPDKLIEPLDEVTKRDLQDGIDTILHLFPTPAAMILFRATESIVRKYYTSVTGNQSGKKSWDNILKELGQIDEMKKSLLGYLAYLKDKRNEAEHPDKRFTQEESERILLQIKGLLQELQLQK